MPRNQSYQSFLKSPSRAHWERIGARRRAGVAAPLWALHSNRSTGIGDWDDLKIFTDIASAAGLSIIQLLPLNELGNHFSPYDALSAFALEPLYLSLESLRGADMAPHAKEIQKLRRRWDLTKLGRVHYTFKVVKMDLLWKIFEKNFDANDPSFNEFKKEASYWLAPYTAYRVLRESNSNRFWQEWPREMANHPQRALKRARKDHPRRMAFYEWLQWQCHEQARSAHAYAASRNVLLMGDMPFLVSRDSADVWSYQKLFRLKYSSGAPPDQYSARGQRWGMPPYDWDQIFRDDFRYWNEKLNWTGRFYDLYRVDHAIGFCRLWTIPLDDPWENQGMNGSYVPKDERLWKSQGRKIYRRLLEGSPMMPCAEDLGVVPVCSNELLAEFAIPGTEIQRWNRKWKAGGIYVEPADYRPNSVASISTHDTTTLYGWWKGDIGPAEERRRFWRYLGLRTAAPSRPTTQLAERALEKMNACASIFSIQSIQDWLCLDPKHKPDPDRDRVNVPGTLSPTNWTYILPYRLDKLRENKSWIKAMHELNRCADRIA